MKGGWLGEIEREKVGMCVGADGGRQRKRDTKKERVVGKGEPHSLKTKSSTIPEPRVIPILTEE